MSDSPTTPQPESNPAPDENAPAVPLTRAQARAAAAGEDPAPTGAEGHHGDEASSAGRRWDATTPPDGSTSSHGSEGPASPAVLDEGTYTAIREPRNAGRIALDGTWHQISPKYVVSQSVQEAIFLVVVIAAAVIVQLLTEQPWPWIPAGVIVLITILSLVILPRQARALGYMLRADDIVFRKGILWQRMVAVPYGRMQLVDITHGPMDRAFGIAKLKMVTAAATTGVEIPGLRQDAAEALRDTLIEVAETRRTGL